MTVNFLLERRIDPRVQMSANNRMTRSIDLLQRTTTVGLKSDRIVHDIDRSNLVFVAKNLNLLDGPYRPNRNILPGKAGRPIEFLFRIDDEYKFSLLCWLYRAKICWEGIQHEIKREIGRILCTYPILG